MTTTSESVRTAISEAFVEANGLRIFYRETGEGPPLILVHGGLATGEVMWSPAVVADLARSHRVLIPDSRGHGRTDNPGGRMRYDQMADDVAVFSAALGLERPTVVGYSDGAQVALEIGLRHPELPAAMVIGGVVTRPVEGYLQALREMGFPAPGAVDLPQVERAMGGFYETLRTSHEHAREDEDFRRYLAEISALWYSVPDYSDAQLARIDVPSLVIVGDRDGVSVDESLRLYRLLPRGELAVVPHADHGAGEKKVFWALVADFLARHVPADPPASAP
jgi:pimeloyl-ACP methyl ester carboxylesterase